MWGTNGRDVAFDVVVSSPMQLATTARAAHEVGWTANRAYQDKMRKYGAICREIGMEMSPLALDTFGGWAPRSAIQIKRLALALARHTGEDQSRAVTHTFQRLSVLLARDNATMFLTRIPDPVDAMISGII
jgi:hypothetical protein